MCTIEVAVGLGNGRWEPVFVEITDDEVDENTPEVISDRAESLAWEQVRRRGWNHVVFTRTLFIPPTEPLIDLEGII